MKNKRKTLILLMCAVLLIAGSTIGTLAYLTAKDTVTNTFTVGSVILGDGNLEKGLDEALVNEDGEPINNDTDKTVVSLNNAPRVQENDYKLVPGHLYTKDPTVHVKNDSEDSYIFVSVANGIANIEAVSETAENGYKTIADQILTNGWIQLKDADGNDVSGVYYKTWKQGNDKNGTTDLLVFAQFKIGGAGVDAAKLAAYKDAKIIVTAYAVQQDGFASAAAAWTATFGTSAGN